MADNLIEIVFRGINEIGEAVEKIKESLSGVSESAEDTTGALDKINSVLKSEQMLRFKEAAVAAFQAVSAVVMEFVDAASEAELVGVRMEATIRALGSAAPVTADQINALADELSKLTGFDDEALVEAQATLARIGSVSEENFDRAARAATDLAAATGMDLNSAFQAVGIALENADFGRLARQIGDLPPEMQKAAKAALEAGDALKAQEIILAGIEQKVGGAGEAIGETFVGQMNKLKTEYGNWQEDFGAPLLEWFVGLPDSVKSAGFAIYSLGGTFGPVISAVADLTIATKGLNGAMGAQGLLGALKGIQITGATALTPLLINLGLVALAVGAVMVVWDQWNKQIVETNEKGQKAVQGTWDKFFADMVAEGASAEEIIDAYRAAQERANQTLDEANPIVRAFISNKNNLVNGDKQLEAALRQVTGSETEFNAAMERAKQTTAEAGAQAAKTSTQVAASGSGFAEFGKQAELAFWGTLNAASTASRQLVTIAGTTIEQMMNAATVWAANTLNSASRTASMLVQIVSTGWQRMVSEARAWFSRALESVRTWGNDLKSAFNRLVSDAASWGRSIVEGIWTGIQNGWEWLKQQISANIESLLDWVKGILGIASPSKLFAVEIGLPMAQGIGAGFQTGMQTVSPSIGAALQPAPAFATIGGGNRSVTVNGRFYSPVTKAERRMIRKDQERIGERMLLEALR